jgi:DnaK suppressor protein
MSGRKDLNYNDFEKVLMAEKARVEKNIETIKAEVEILADDNDINDVEDMAEVQIENSKDQTLLHHLQDELREVEAALERIHNKTYGICEKSGKPIPLERLKVYPLARTFAIK